MAKEAYSLAQKNKEKHEILGALKQLSKVDPSNALKYSEEYFQIDDSLKIAERKIQNKFARIEFETEELTLQKGKLEEQRKSLIYITLGIITLGVFIFVIRFQAAKNRELRLIQEQQQANEEVYQLMLNQQDRIEEVRQAEKKRIAQELHDGVLGRLFGTRMNLGVLNTKSDEKAIAERIAYIDELKSVEQEIREISHDLSAEKAAIFNNFVLMVSNFIATQRTVCQAAIDIHIDDTIDWNSVNSTAKINLYRILQEAFQNVNKHANAQNVTVRFFKSNDDLRLEVRDDGVGFNYAKKKKGIGLINMLNRITNSRGSMEIETAPGAGTLLKFVLPLSDT
ncbi:MAG TPA: ATP-binding protein [Flavobacterium sp.]|nr:ATP-binding protein [Flavobacterium sp.]